MLRRNHDQLIGRTVTVKDILSSIRFYPINCTYPQ